MFFLVLPLLLPRGFNSVLLAAGSHPSVVWLSLVSYRDVHDALRYGTYPPLEWVQIRTGEGALRVLATCLIGTIVPALVGWWPGVMWSRTSIAWSAVLASRAVGPDPVSRVKLLPAPEPGSPLAEPGGAV